MRIRCLRSSRLELLIKYAGHDVVGIEIRDGCSAPLRRIILVVSTQQLHAICGGMRSQPQTEVYSNFSLRVAFPLCTCHLSK